MNMTADQPVRGDARLMKEIADRVLGPALARHRTARLMPSALIGGAVFYLVWASVVWVLPGNVGSGLRLDEQIVARVRHLAPAAPGWVGRSAVLAICIGAAGVGTALVRRIHLRGRRPTRASRLMSELAGGGGAGSRPEIDRYLSALAVSVLGEAAPVHHWADVGGPSSAGSGDPVEPLTARRSDDLTRMLNRETLDGSFTRQWIRADRTRLWPEPLVAGLVMAILVMLIAVQPDREPAPAPIVAVPDVGRPKLTGAMVEKLAGMLSSRRNPSAGPADGPIVVSPRVPLTADKAPATTEPTKTAATLPSTTMTGPENAIEGHATVNLKRAKLYSPTLTAIEQANTAAAAAATTQPTVGTSAKSNAAATTQLLQVLTQNPTKADQDSADEGERLARAFRNGEISEDQRKQLEKDAENKAQQELKKADEEHKAAEKAREDQAAAEEKRKAADQQAKEAKLRGDKEAERKATEEAKKSKEEAEKKQKEAEDHEKSEDEHRDKAKALIIKGAILVAIASVDPLTAVAAAFAMSMGDGGFGNDGPGGGPGGDHHDAPNGHKSESTTNGQPSDKGDPNAPAGDHAGNTPNSQATQGGQGGETANANGNGKTAGDGKDGKGGQEGQPGQPGEKNSPGEPGQSGAATKDANKNVGGSNTNNQKTGAAAQGALAGVPADGSFTSNDENGQVVVRNNQNQVLATLPADVGHHSKFSYINYPPTRPGVVATTTDGKLVFYGPTGAPDELGVSRDLLGVDLSGDSAHVSSAQTYVIRLMALQPKPKLAYQRLPAPGQLRAWVFVVKSTDATSIIWVIDDGHAGLLFERQAGDGLKAAYASEPVGGSKVDGAALFSGLVDHSETLPTDGHDLLRRVMVLDVDPQAAGEHGPLKPRLLLAQPDDDIGDHRPRGYTLSTLSGDGKTLEFRGHLVGRCFETLFDHSGSPRTEVESIFFGDGLESGLGAVPHTQPSPGKAWWMDGWHLRALNLDRAEEYAAVLSKGDGDDGKSLPTRIRLSRLEISDSHPRSRESTVEHLIKRYSALHATPVYAGLPAPDQLFNSAADVYASWVGHVVDLHGPFQIWQDDPNEVLSLFADGATANPGPTK